MRWLEDRFGQAGKVGEKERLQAAAIFIVALLLATAPVDLLHFSFAILGALAYSLMRRTMPSVKKFNMKQIPCDMLRGRCAQPKSSRHKEVPPQWLYTQDYRKPSTQPILPVTFNATGWDSEVEELLSQITPTQQSDQVVQKLSDHVKNTLKHLLPEAEVFGVAHGDLLRGTAFGVAVPDVDIVVCIPPKALAARLNSRLRRGRAVDALDARKLQKSAIRACTEVLVASGNFKFRRSAFRCMEPKVTLLMPATAGIHAQAVPVDFSVNAALPLHGAALLAECGQMEPRAKALIVLVRRWAKDRGVCHASKGHLSPYAWTLLAIYFLQVGIPEGALLPPFKEFGVSSGLTGGFEKSIQTGASDLRRNNQPLAPSWLTVGELFRRFFYFYRGAFDFGREVVSVRIGRRSSPAADFPLHSILDASGRQVEIGPSIEDPFNPKQNVAASLILPSLRRLREELLRATLLLGGDVGGSPCSPSSTSRSPLASLLVPWVPPERDTSPEDGGEGCQAEGSSESTCLGGGGAAATAAAVSSDA